MKFLSNFDTEIDTLLLQNALQEYDEDHILLIKKHPIFLLKGWFWYIFIFGISGLFIWLLFQINKDYQRFETTLAIGVILLLLFWIFITFRRYYRYSFFFHTNIHNSRELNSHATKKLDTFIRGSIGLIIGFIVILILFEIKQIIWGINSQRRITLGGGICILLIILAIYQLIFIHIRYDLDFLLITPDYVEHVHQKSFFSRKQRTVKAKQIRTIELSQDGLLQGLFHLGKATFVTDALDGQKDVYLTFNYIGNASEIKREVLKLLKK